MAKKDFNIDQTPTTKVYSFFKKLSYTFKHALAEFTDNSIASFRKHIEYFNENNIEKEITVIFDASKSQIIIRDNAYGIDEKNIPNAIKLQELNEDTQSGPNEFGMGLKTGGLWLGDLVTIITKSPSDTNGWKVSLDLEKLSTGNNIAMCVESDEYKNDSINLNRGTFITIDKVDSSKLQATSLQKIVNFFESKYRFDIFNHDIKIRFIVVEKNGKIIDLVKLGETTTSKKDSEIKVWNNSWKIGTPMKFIFPAIRHKDGKELKSNFEVEFDVSGKIWKCKGWIAVKEVGTRQSFVGFSLLRRNIVIIESWHNVEVFGMMNSFETLRLFGEITFPNDFPITQAKDKFDWEGELESKFAEALKNNPIIKEYKKISVNIRNHNDNKVDTFKESKQEKQIEFLSEKAKKTFGPETKISQSNDDNYGIEIEIKTDIGIQKMESRIIESAEAENWIDYEMVDEKIIVTTDINHPFFSPFISENDNFISTLRMFSLVFVKCMLESEKTKSPISQFKDDLGVMLRKNFIND